MIKKYYFYEVVQGDSNKVVVSGIVWVWFFNGPSDALAKIIDHYKDRFDGYSSVSNMRRIK